VPWVSAQLGDAGFDLGHLHTSKMNRCFAERRCQICGEPIVGRIVFFLSESALPSMHAGEPPMHPECAAYSARACPMVNGRMRHYRTSLSRVYGPAGKQCDIPGCDCGGWKPISDDEDRNRGRPAEPWYAVWCHDYAVTAPDERTKALVEKRMTVVGVSLGASIDNPLKVRPVRTDTDATECPA
jgi:hypothetical protein